MKIMQNGKINHVTDAKNLFFSQIINLKLKLGKSVEIDEFSLLLKLLRL